MKSFTLIAAFTLIAGSNAWWWSTPKPFWNDLQVKFGLPLESKRYASMPRDTTAAVNDFKLVKISGDDCTNGNTFHGQRYIFPDDYTMALLYDNQGYIAGIQMILNQDELAKSGTSFFNYGAVPMFQSEVLNGKNVYTLTTYFVQPDTICKTGRTADDFATEGTGVGLYFQNGKSIDTLLVAPTDRKDAVAPWSTNKCFIGMGWHNFYNVESFDSTSCTTVQPVFLLFDEDDKLKGFGYVAFGNANSVRYEHPDSTAIKLIVGSPTPKCLTDYADSVKVSSMHVFFQSDAQWENCIRL